MILSVYACGNTCVTSKVNLIQSNNVSGRIYTLPLIYILHYDEELQFWVHTAYKLFLSMKGTLMNENNAIVIWVTNGRLSLLFHSVDISMWIPIKKIMSPFMIPAASWGLFPLFTMRTLSSLHPIRHIPLLLLSHTASSHLFHSQLLSKSIRSLAAFLGQSKPISASSFKHICHPVRRSEDVLAVHTQHSEQTGILTSSRADLSQPLIVNPAPLWAPTPTPKSQPTCS